MIKYSINKIILNSPATTQILSCDENNKQNGRRLQPFYYLKDFEVLMITIIL